MITMILICPLIVLAIPVCFLSIEVAASIVALRRNYRLWSEQDGSCVLAEEVKLAVLVPAHDEEDVIESTLEGIREQLRPQDRLLVVADNCSDSTAVVAGKKGAEVIERDDATKRGKGYALDFGIQFLKSNPPDVVVIMDADVQVGTNAIPTLARLAYRYQRPVQAKYILSLSGNAGYRAMLSAFAFLFKNYIRPLGLMRLGGGCLLTGTGMAFVWKDIASVKLASGNIVEDMQLGMDLAVGGSVPLYCPEALVTSDVAPSASAALKQRTRWEHGHFHTILRNTGWLYCEAIRQRKLDLALLGLELSVPPLASMVLLLGGGILLSLALHWLDLTSLGIVLIFCALLALLTVCVLASWFFFGRRVLSSRILLFIPVYILWKVPVYMQLVLRRKVGWIKTKRIKSIQMKK